MRKGSEVGRGSGTFRVARGRVTRILNGEETSPARARTRNIVLSDHPVVFEFHPGGSAPVLHK